MRLPEYACPHCERSVTLVPEAGRDTGRSHCSDCKGTVVLVPNGQLAIPLPEGITIEVAPEMVEVTFEGWFFTLGIADSALVYRVDPDAIVWSRPPFLGQVRVTEAWERLERAALRSIDWRVFESGIRGTNTEDQWADIVFVAHDGAERRSGHKLAASLDGPLVTRILERAHDDGVPRRDAARNTYRSAAGRSRSPLLLLRSNGELVHLGSGPLG